jgi:hypothetical protein
MAAKVLEGVRLPRIRELRIDEGMGLWKYSLLLGITNR